MKISFRKVEEKDLPLIRRWIKTNNCVKRWYYHGRVPQTETLKKKIIDRQKISGFFVNIVLFDKKPIGYLQSYNVDGWGNWTRKVKMFENTAGIDYFIGEKEFLHKGYGPLMISEYVEMVVKRQGYDFVIATPEPDNIASCRCLEKCGFVFQKVENIPYSTSKHSEAVFLKKLK